MNLFMVTKQATTIIFIDQIKSKRRKKNMNYLKLIFIVVGLIVVWVVWRKWSRSNSIQKANAQKVQIANKCENAPTIFVSIASYRDPECAKTINDLFIKAVCPLRVFVGICVQNSPKDPNPQQEYLRLSSSLHQKDMSDHIRWLFLNYTDARGPMYARGLIEEKLYRNEIYYLIIDSHTRFYKGWDEECIAQLARCEKESSCPVLTYCPEDYETDRMSKRLGEIKIPSFWRLSQKQKLEGVQYKQKPKRPLPSLFWSPVFSFCKASIMKKCPYSKDFPFIFYGEQFLMALLYYSYGGCDFYSPNCVIVQHKWSRDGRYGLFWDDLLKNNPHNIAIEKQSQNRLDQYYKNIFSQNTVRNYFEYCGYFPFDPDKTHIKAFRGIDQITARVDETSCKLG